MIKKRSKWIKKFKSSLSKLFEQVVIKKINKNWKKKKSNYVFEEKSLKLRNGSRGNYNINNEIMMKDDFIHVNYILQKKKLK